MPLFTEYVLLVLFTFANKHYLCISTAFLLLSLFKVHMLFYQMMCYFIKMQRCLDSLYTQCVLLIQVKATWRNFLKNLSGLCAMTICILHCLWFLLAANIFHIEMAPVLNDYLHFRRIKSMSLKEKMQGLMEST